ncbi:diglucosyl diacylglycerol synthase [Bacillus sp. FJAT-45066]|uniref:diglucosyl diacylglycerol synthase n=1 Tax=Bacillus sp. FJAT-45066 TaxID=2011010 RepID=UPI000BB7C216|nr:diglucosyl diacylglycerol synthase [Bacillus sp. FJAT-45066]
MESKVKVLILTATYGNGHVQVANTLKLECEKRGMEVKVCDLFAESHPKVTKMTKKLYLKSYSVGKQLYRLFYYGVEKVYNKKLFRWYYTFGMNRLLTLVQQEQPDILINTFPINAVPEYRKITGHYIPTYTVVTDFCLHKLWIHELIDGYFVATNDVKNSIRKFGTPSSSINVTGIPIRKAFYEKQMKTEIIKKYKLNKNKKLILIMAGAHGVLKNLTTTCERLLTSSEVEVAVVCGNNLMLKKELENAISSNRFHVYGFVDSIHEFMQVATCVITKPGGITLSEATAIGVPLILYNPVPGQERENAIYFQKKRAAFIAYKKDELIIYAYKVLGDEDLQTTMRDSCRTLNVPFSAEKIVNSIMKERKKKRDFVFPSTTKKSL